jgi:hypothetical protein
MNGRYFGPLQPIGLVGRRRLGGLNGRLCRSPIPLIGWRRADLSPALSTDARACSWENDPPRSLGPAHSLACTPGPRRRGGRDSRTADVIKIVGRHFVRNRAQRSRRAAFPPARPVDDGHARPAIAGLRANHIPGFDLLNDLLCTEVLSLSVAPLLGSPFSHCESAYVAVLVSNLGTDDPVDSHSDLRFRLVNHRAGTNPGTATAISRPLRRRANQPRCRAPLQILNHGGTGLPLSRPVSRAQSGWRHLPDCSQRHLNLTRSTDGRIAVTCRSSRTRTVPM